MELASRFTRSAMPKGSKARAEKLSAKKRSEIAKKVAITRWKRSDD